MEEVTDDSDFWGKTTAWSSGLPRRKESRNGALERQLTSSEWAVAAYLGVGEKLTKWDGSFGRRLLL
jgi:hypothetical protein